MIWPFFAREVPMADDKMKKTDDRRRIDVHETYELGYWSRKFGVPREQLAEAVQKVGPVAADVERELGR
jgi:hypothetical protein